MKDEVTGNAHPGTSGIMYVSLTKLSEEDSAAGELAAFLLGKMTDPRNDDVKKIAKTFNASFAAFKADKEVVRMLSLAERYEHDGMVKGETRGKAKGRVQGFDIGANRIVELIKAGLSPDDALRKASEEKVRLVEVQLED